MCVLHFISFHFILRFIQFWIFMFFLQKDKMSKEARGPDGQPIGDKSIDKAAGVFSNLTNYCQSWIIIFKTLCVNVSLLNLHIENVWVGQVFVGFAVLATYTRGLVTYTCDCWWWFKFCLSGHRCRSSNWRRGIFFIFVFHFHVNVHDCQILWWIFETKCFGPFVSWRAQENRRRQKRPQRPPRKRKRPARDNPKTRNKFWNKLLISKSFVNVVTFVMFS